MATFTSNFSSWSGFEALLTEAQAFESGAAYVAIQNDLIELQSTLFFAEPIDYSGSNTSLTVYYPDGITAHVSGTNLLGSNPVITRADVTNGTYTMVLAGSVSVSADGMSLVGAITSIGLTGPGYAQLAVGRIPMDGSTVVFTSWSSTLPIGLEGESVSIAATGTDTIDPFGNETITYSKITISDGSGHTASISGLNYTVTNGSVDYVALVHELLAGSDVANGGSGNNELYTFAGNDTLDGKAGADTMVGGVGNDTYYVENTGDIVLETDNSPTDGSGLARSLDLGDTIDKVVASINYILPDYVEDLTLAGSALTGTGNELDNRLTGNIAANTLSGNAGADTLIGGAGNDTLIGGLGDDTYLVDNAGDVITENENEGIDSVQSSANRTLDAHLENLTLTGAAAINGIGNGLDNLLAGNAAANILNGGSGADTMAGGDGADTYVVDDAGDLVGETSALAAGGSDLVQSSISYALGANLEKLTLTGAAAIDGKGNALANIITGNGGNNTLDGAAGIDTLVGGAGNDGFVVDSLTDMVTELADGGYDSVLVDTTLTAGTFVMAANVEYGQLGGTDNLNLTGNAANNVMAGNGGANVLDGGAGNDVLNAGGGNDMLRGGAGNDALDGQRSNDRMEGGLGNDSYYVNRGDGAGTAITANEDKVVELAAAGTDTVHSYVYTYTLDANVENLVLQSGNLARKGFGNAADNVMTGNSLKNVLSGEGGNDTLSGGDGNDTLYGGNGNDLLDGGLGKDVMTGGAGNDTFVFSTALNAATNSDRIIDFTAGLDTIQLSNSIFTALGQAGGLNADFFYSGASAQDADDHIIFNASTGALYYDLDGTGGTDQVQFATLAAGSALAGADFIVGL